MYDEIKEKFKCLLIELLEVPSEERMSEILEVLDRISPDPSYTDYVYYYTDELCDDRGELDIDKVVTKVFNYSPIIL